MSDTTTLAERLSLLPPLSHGNHVSASASGHDTACRCAAHDELARTLVDVRCFIQADRDCFFESYTVGGDAAMLDAEEADALATMDAMLARIDAALARAQAAPR